MSAFHADLKRGRFIPKVSFGRVSSRIVRRVKWRSTDPGPDVTVQEIVVPGPRGAPPVSLRVFQPAGLTAAAPALLWIHGGGLIFGAPEQDDRTNIAFARELGITVAAVRYRLGPDHPAPAAVEDAYAALRGLAERAGDLHIDIGRVAIGGASAGGGIAAALALLAHDRAEIRPVFQLLLYPMLDDRTTTRTDLDTLKVRVSDAQEQPIRLVVLPRRRRRGPGRLPVRGRSPPRGSHRSSSGLDRRRHPRSLPRRRRRVPRRLSDSGVPCDLDVIPGAFHGFDLVFPKAEVSRESGAGRHER